MTPRRTRGPSGRTLAGVFVCVAGVAAPAVANEPAQPRLSFTLDQRLEAARNRRLTVPSEGDTTQSVTRLGFALVSETVRDSLSFTGNTAYRLGTEPEGRLREFDDPRLALRYLREGANSEFSVTASARRSRQEFLDITDFLDEDGNLDLPEDFEDLERIGRRTSYDLVSTLVLGRDPAPLGATFQLGVRAIEYSDGAPQADIRTVFGSVQTRARISPVMSATVGLSREERREETTPRTRRVTDSVTAGLTYAISPRTDVNATLGWSRVERTGTNPSREEGLIGNFGMVTDTPLGPIGLQLGAEQIEAGQRLSGSISRTLETPTGALSGSVGAARQPGGDVNLIGTVGWSQPLPTGNINVALSRASVGNEDPRVRTTLSTGLTHQINSVSSIGLRADYARTDASALRGSLEQATVSATYSHQLTPDWALNSGVSYRQRREASGATARSPEVFLGMGRSFEWPL